MKVFVLGGGSKTGKLLIKQAVERGWQVVAGVKDPRCLGDVSTEELLKVSEIDVSDSGSMVTGMKGCDCVISCLTPESYSSYMPWSKVNIFSESIGPILEAMSQVSLDRIMVLSSWCTKSSPDGSRSKLFESFLKPLCLGGVLGDMSKMEDILVTSEKINYTIVKPPVAADDKSRGKVLTLTDAQFNPEADGCMSREDLVTWMLDNANNQEFYQKNVVVGNPVKK